MTTMMPEAEERTFVHEPGDEDKLAHYVKKDRLADGYVFGAEVEALCGHRWVPTKDPDRFPICPKCQEIIDAMPPVP